MLEVMERDWAGSSLPPANGSPGEVPHDTNESPTQMVAMDEKALRLMSQVYSCHSHRSVEFVTTEDHVTIVTNSTLRDVARG